MITRFIITRTIFYTYTSSTKIRINKIRFNDLFTHICIIIIYSKILKILGSDFELANKDEARNYFNQLRQLFIDWNYSPWMSDGFKKKEQEIDSFYSEKKGTLVGRAAELLKDGE